MEMHDDVKMGARKSWDYVPRIDNDRVPAVLKKGVTQSLADVLRQENLSPDSPQAGLVALSMFDLLMARWCAYPCSLRTSLAQSGLLGMDEAALETYWHSPETSLSMGVINRIDLLSRMSIALQIMLSHNVQQEVAWLEYRNHASAPLMELLDNRSPLEFISANGIGGLEILCSYLEEKAERVQNNERYLVCLGVCNTLLDTPHVQLDMVLSMAMQGVKNSEAKWQDAIMAVRDLPTAIPLGKRHVLLPRPHLQALVAYIQQHPNLDVAIISGATHEYIGKFVGMVAPELLEMCQFIWAREDESCYYKRGAGTTFKSLENIPELKGYRSGRILMVEHNDVFPYESRLSVKPFYGESVTETYLQNENDLQDVIRRLAILTQVDDIIALRKKEDTAFRKYAEQVTAWANENKISMFDAGYNEKMAACPFKAPIPIDEIEVPNTEYHSMEDGIE